MGKFVLFAVFFVLALGLVLASPGNNAVSSGNKADVQNASSIQNQGDDIQIRNEEKAGNPDLGNNVETKLRDMSSHSSLNFSVDFIQNRTQLRVNLSNGRNAEIKVMPETASVRAIERLGLKVCNESNNCTIQLKEVGTGNQTRVAYEVQAQKEARVLGIFKTKINITADIDAETEEVIKTNKPWWAFLASE